MNQLLFVTDLPRWFLELVEHALMLIAKLSGHTVSLSSVRNAEESAND